jgi:hypothetical protein
MVTSVALARKVLLIVTKCCGASLRILFTVLLHPRDTQVREHLLLVDGGELLDRFEFDKNEMVDDQIGAKADVESQVIPNQRYGLFPLDGEPALGQLVSENRLIDRLQQPWPKPSMYVNGHFDDRSAQFIVGQGRVSKELTRIRRRLCASA